MLFVINQRSFKFALKSAESRLDLAKKESDRGKDLPSKSSLSQEALDENGCVPVKNVH